MPIIDKKYVKNCEMSKKSSVLYINGHNRQLTDGSLHYQYLKGETEICLK